MKALNLVLVVSLSLPMGFGAWADDAPSTPPPAATTGTAGSTGPASLSVNPTSLRVQLMNSNLSLVQSLNSVRDAKTQVSVARDSLFPSLNIGATGSMSVGSVFLSTVQFLLPFLLPSNWFNYHAQKNTFTADEYSFQILALNTYASALTLYYTIMSDQDTQAIYNQEYADLKKIYDTQDELVKLGTASLNDILPAQAQSQLAGVQASQLAQLVVQDIASLRQALGLPLTTNITLERPTLIPTMPEESQPLQDVVDKANTIAPEHQQIDFLAKAAKEKKWSTVFSFIGSATMSSMVNPSASVGASLTTYNSLAGLSLGFALFPEIKLASHNIDEINLLNTQLVQSNTSVIESAVKGLVEAKSQYDMASQAEQAMLQAYATKNEEYQLGFVTLTDLLVARTQEAQSQVARIAAELDMNLLRVTLQRALLEGEFANIEKCDLTKAPKDIKGKSMDEVCKAAATLAPNPGTDYDSNSNSNANSH